MMYSVTRSHLVKVHTDPALKAAVCQRDTEDTVVADKAEKAVEDNVPVDMAEKDTAAVPEDIVPEDTLPVDMAVDSLVFPCRPSRLLQAAKIINTVCLLYTSPSPRD